MRYAVRKLSVMMLIFVAALNIPFYVFAQAEPQITGNAVVSQIGDRVEAVFSITDAESICGGNFNIVYNSEYLQVVSAKAGSVFETTSPVINTKYDKGKIRVTWAGMTPFEKSGDLITVEFTVKEGAPSGVLSVAVENLKLYDFDTQTVPSQVTNAEIEVKNTYLVLVPENNGDKVSVGVNLAGDTMCLGGNFVLEYDSSALTPASVGTGALVTGTTVSQNLSYSSNSLKVSWAGMNPITEKGELFKIIFNVNEGYSGNVRFNIKSTTLYDENSKALAVQSEKVSLDIEEITAQLPFITVGKTKSQDEGSLSVSIDKNSMVCGGGLEILYDNTAVEILDVALGDALAGKTPTINTEYEPNVMKLSWASALPMTATGELINISFRVKDPSKEFAAFCVKKLNLYDSDMNPVEASYRNGGVAISCEESECLTSTSFKRENGVLSFESFIFNNPEVADVIVALYERGKMKAFVTGEISNDGYISLSAEDVSFDSCKVMMWNSKESMIPCSAQEQIN